MNKCNECKWWHGEGWLKDYGDCRRHAPSVPFVYMVGDYKYQSAWVKTEQDDWCGDFEAKENS